MTCKCCGATEFKEEGYQNICQQCGNVDDSLFLVNDAIPLMSTFMKYDLPDKSIAFRNFKQLYHCCTRTLNTSCKITEEGVLMLPQMWEFVRNKRFKTKKLFIVAMLYLLYRQHHVPVTFSQFLKHAHVPQERLANIVQFVMRRFNLPMFKCMNVGDITANSISELVKLVFKESTKEMETESQHLSQRLVNVIYRKEWGETSSKNYISLVCIVGTLLSAQYVVSNMTHRKRKDGRKACFRFMTMNYQKMADHMCVHIMAVQRCLKVVQQKLFELVQKVPWTAACIKKSIDVARVLVELLDYIDIDPKDDDDEDVPSIPPEIKLSLIQAIQTYISMDAEVKQEERAIIDIGKLQHIFNAKLISENGESNGNISIYNKDKVVIKGHVITLHHLELFKDLLLSGCSIIEIVEESYIPLVEKYIDMSSVQDEDDMEGFTEEEMAIYFKNPTLLSEESKAELTTLLSEESKAELPTLLTEESKAELSTLLSEESKAELSTLLTEESKAELKVDEQFENIDEHTKLQDQVDHQIKNTRVLNQLAVK